MGCFAGSGDAGWRARAVATSSCAAPFTGREDRPKRSEAHGAAKGAVWRARKHGRAGVQEGCNGQASGSLARHTAPAHLGVAAFAMAIDADLHGGSIQEHQVVTILQRDARGGGSMHAPKRLPMRISLAERGFERCVVISVCILTSLQSGGYKRGRQLV